MASTEATIGVSLRHRHTSWPVDGSKAFTNPCMSLATVMLAPKYGRLSLNSTRRGVMCAPTSITGA